jgi:hypothetical protein
MRTRNVNDIVLAENHRKSLFVGLRTGGGGEAGRMKNNKRSEIPRRTAAGKKNETKTHKQKKGIG